MDLPTARSTSSVGSDTEFKGSPFATMDQGHAAAAPSQHLRAAQPQEMNAMRSSTNSTVSEDFLLGDSTNKMPAQAGNPIQDLTAASNASLAGAIDGPHTPTQVRCRGVAGQGSADFTFVTRFNMAPFPRNGRRSSIFVTNSPFSMSHALSTPGSGNPAS